MKRIDKNQFGPWAIVTGASSGIGKEFARQLAASGIHLVLVARRLSLLEEIGRELAHEYGIQYRAIGVDLAVDGFLEKINNAAHDLDVGLLISNAGTGHPREFLNVEQDELLRTMRLNAVSHLLLTRHYGRKLAQRGRGGVLLVSAMGAPQGLPYMANDGGSKAYVASLGTALNYEFKKLGVNVSVLLPGPTDTPVIAELGIDPATLPLKPMSVEQCVAEGLSALIANRPTHISGRMNRIMSVLMPSSLAIKFNGIMLGKASARKRAKEQTVVTERI
jgi:short-subunit dehydrogenase